MLHLNIKNSIPILFQFFTKTKNSEILLKFNSGYKKEADDHLLLYFLVIQVFG